MDARQLEYFLAIVDHDGFGRAAQALHLAQPSLSQAIAGLERELGVQLFHRIGRGVVLSAAGTELIEPARQVLRDLRAARAAMESTKGVQRGRVELVTMPSPGIEPLSTLTRAFTERFPGITVGAEAAFTPDEVVHQIKQGVCEIGVIGTAGPLRPPGVEVFPLEAQHFVLVGAAGAPFPDGDPVPPSAISGTGLIASPPGSLMRQIVDDVLATATSVRIVAEVAHRTSILPLVLQGAGLAVLPAAWAPLARAAGARVAGVDHPARLHVALVVRPGRLTPAAQAFLATARSHTPGDYA
ncbi:LysR family transcriptional regulator [Lentzea sp. NPDC058436]|uniref:LysR family transcriptional regulator n=1 Tax=Lentzea sp. NPDC058436 TaxID=3346499 RepID=UPI00364B01BF